MHQFVLPRDCFFQLAFTVSCISICAQDEVYACFIGGTLGRRRWVVEVNVVGEELFVLRTSREADAVFIVF